MPAEFAKTPPSHNSCQPMPYTCRTETPWLIVVFLEAKYSTFSWHYKENKCMRVVYQPLLTRHKVDVYLHGECDRSALESPGQDKLADVPLDSSQDMGVGLSRLLSPC